MRVIFASLLAASFLVSSVEVLGNDNNKAIQMDSSTCTVLDAAQNVVVAVEARGAKFHGVFTHAGVNNLTCTGHLPTGSALPDKNALKLNYFNTQLECISSLPGTPTPSRNWQLIINKTGRFVFRCHFKVN